MTYQKILKHGHSLAVVIPAQIARDLKWKRGDWVRMGVFGDDIKRFHIDI